MYCRICQWSHLVLGFCFWKSFDYWFNLLLVIVLFRFSTSLRFRLRRWYVFSNLSISSRLSNSLVYSVHSRLLRTFAYLWYHLKLPFHLWLYLFSLFFMMLAKCLSILFILQEPALSCIDLFYFLNLFFIYFWMHLCYHSFLQFWAFTCSIL